MAKQRQVKERALEGLAAAVEAKGSRGAPPVHLWNPPYCGDLDIRIDAEGGWHYLGSPIGRPGLVRLFASVLKREGDRYFLVTPVEKIGIQVDDAPFVAIELRREEGASGQRLLFRTNLDEWIACDGEHRLRFEPDSVAADASKPYLHVRHDLWARVGRSVFYDLVDLGETRTVDGARYFGIASEGHFFPMAPAKTIEDTV